MQGNLTPRYPLVVFDFDGTLIPHEGSVWRTIHTRLGSDPLRRRAVVRAGLSGEISYAEWFAADVEMLRKNGVSRSDLLAIADSFSPTPGALELLADLRAGGARLAVLSGGLHLVCEQVFSQHPFDIIHANRLIFDDAGLLSDGVATPFDMERKGEGIVALAAALNLAPSSVAFVGDGPNDVSAAHMAGFSVAWGDAFSGLIEASSVCVVGPHMDSLRPFLFEGI